MSGLCKQITIYSGLLLMSSTYTLIAPFLPKVSQEKNLPLWLIGLIFALNPIGNVITSLFLGKYLNQLGRKPVLIASYFITGLSLLFLCPIELVDRDLMIVLAIISRLLGGIGVSCLYTCQLTIFISDYPDQMQVMLGRMEAFIGIGMISGPLIGVALYSISLFIALLSIGVVLVVFSVISWKSMGNFRPYEIKKLDISLTRLSLKLRIFLSIILHVLFMTSFGFFASILEIHLSSYNESLFTISLCFALQSSVYLIFSLSGAYLFKMFDPRLVIIVGALLECLAFAMFAPFPLIFPDSSWVIIASIPLMGLGQVMCYIFSIPYMIRCAVDDYGYAEDDILTDAVSSLAVFAGGIGEIIGPLASVSLSEVIGIKGSSVLVSGFFLCFAFVFFFGSGYADEKICKKNTKQNLILDETFIKTK